PLMTYFLRASDSISCEFQLCSASATVCKNHPITALFVDSVTIFSCSSAELLGISFLHQTSHHHTCNLRRDFFFLPQQPLAQLYDLSYKRSITIKSSLETLFFPTLRDLLLYLR
ncbi:hypothetical protein CU098_001374, partial [Rhizopus stolonifer]